jgi:hypothetical protein
MWAIGCGRPPTSWRAEIAGTAVSSSNDTLSKDAESDAIARFGVACGPSDGAARRCTSNGVSHWTTYASDDSPWFNVRMRTLLAIAVTLVVLAALGSEAAARDRKRKQPDSAPDQACTPGYNPCIPPGPDVDCAGGSGDGPRYVEGPVRVTGSDPYGLDRDHDGIGCE